MSLIDLIKNTDGNNTLFSQIKEKFLTREGLANTPPKQIPAMNLFLKGVTDSINNVNVTSVLWEPGEITVYPLSDVEDAISFQFSGCIMAKFKCNNRYYVAHIHVADNKTDKREQWIDFLTQTKAISEIIMFKPSRGVYAYEIWGIITQDGLCYSVGFDCFGQKIVFNEHVSYGNSLRDYQELFSFKVDKNAEKWNDFWERPYARPCRI